MNAFGCRSSSWMSVPSSRLRSLVALLGHRAQVAHHPQAVADHLGQPVSRRSTAPAAAERPISHQFRFSNIAGLPPAIPAQAIRSRPRRVRDGPGQFASAASVTEAVWVSVPRR